jgi:hypothetical protein
VPRYSLSQRLHAPTGGIAASSRFWAGQRSL